MSQEVSFVAEEINSIVKDILESQLASVTYQHGRISALTENVIEEILKKLVSFKRPYKYLVSAVIMQRTGAGLHTACSAFWDTTSDGVAVVRWENRSIYCVVTIFGVAI